MFNLGNSPDRLSLDPSFTERLRENYRCPVIVSWQLVSVESLDSEVYAIFLRPECVPQSGFILRCHYRQ